MGRRGAEQDRCCIEPMESGHHCDGFFGGRRRTMMYAAMVLGIGIAASLPVMEASLGIDLLGVDQGLSRGQGTWGDRAAMLMSPGATSGRLCLRGGAVRELPKGADEKKSKKKPLKQTPTQYRLFIANLPSGLNDEGLREAFEAFGDLEEAKVMRDIETGQSRRMGYVSFKTEEQMDEALDEMNKAKLCAPATSGGPPVCTKIEVHIAKPQQQNW